MRIAIDFDGVIHNPYDREKGERMGKPIIGAKEALRNLKRKGHYLIIHTVRGGSPEHVKDWLNFYGMSFNEITNIKPDDVAFFIDDHALRFEGDWDSTLNTLYSEDKSYRRRRGIKLEDT